MSLSTTIRQVDAQYRFNRVYQRNAEPLTEFYERFLEEVEIFEAAGNHFIDIRFDEDADNADEMRVQARAEIEAHKAMVFMTHLSRERYR